MFSAVNSISISGMLTPSDLLGQKVKPRCPPMEANFGCQFQSSSRSCTSVPVFCMNFQFLFGLTSKTFPTMEKCSDEIILDQFYIFQCLKGFVIAVWPKQWRSQTRASATSMGASQNVFGIFN